MDYFSVSIVCGLNVGPHDESQTFARISPTVSQASEFQDNRAVGTCHSMPVIIIMKLTRTSCTCCDGSIRYRHTASVSPKRKRMYFIHVCSLREYAVQYSFLPDIATKVRYVFHNSRRGIAF